MAKITAATVMGLQVKTPNIQEQRYIGKVLDSVDAVIGKQLQVLRKKHSILLALTESFMAKAAEYPSMQLASIVDSAVDGPFGSSLKGEHYVDSPAFG